MHLEQKKNVVLLEAMLAQTDAVADNKFIRYSGSYRFHQVFIWAPDVVLLEELIQTA